MNQQAESSNQNVHDKSSGNPLSYDFVDQQKEIFQLHIDVEFALTLLTIAKMVGNFADPGLRSARGEQIHQDFETGTGQVRSGLAEISAINQEETDHGV